MICQVVRGVAKEKNNLTERASVSLGGGGGSGGSGGSGGTEPLQAMPNAPTSAIRPKQISGFFMTDKDLLD